MATVGLDKLRDMYLLLAKENHDIDVDEGLKITNNNIPMFVGILLFSQNKGKERTGTPVVVTDNHSNSTIKIVLKNDTVIDFNQYDNWMYYRTRSVNSTKEKANVNDIPCLKSKYDALLNEIKILLDDTKTRLETQGSSENVSDLISRIDSSLKRFLSVDEAEDSDNDIWVYLVSDAVSRFIYSMDNNHHTAYKFFTFFAGYEIYSSVNYNIKYSDMLLESVVYRLQKKYMGAPIAYPEITKQFILSMFKSEKNKYEQMKPLVFCDAALLNKTPYNIIKNKEIPELLNMLAKNDEYVCLMKTVEYISMSTLAVLDDSFERSILEASIDETPILDTQDDGTVIRIIEPIKYGIKLPGINPDIIDNFHINFYNGNARYFNETDLMDVVIKWNDNTISHYLMDNHTILTGTVGPTIKRLVKLAVDNATLFTSYTKRRILEEPHNKNIIGAHAAVIGELLYNVDRIDSYVETDELAKELSIISDNDSINDSVYEKILEVMDKLAEE